MNTDSPTAARSGCRLFGIEQGDGVVRLNVNRQTVRMATIDDLPAILAVQRDAFARVAAELKIDPQLMPPLSETLHDLRELHRSGCTFFVALSPQEDVIGSVRAIERDGTVEIGRLVVDGKWVRRGVATQLMDALENAFLDSARFLLFTGADASTPLALYAARGYTLVRRETTPATTLVWLEKCRTR